MRGEILFTALANTLSDPHCRYLCIFNWESIRSSDAILKSITELVEASARDGNPPAK